MKTNTIFIGNFKIEFYKTRKEYIIYLVQKSIPAKNSFTKLPKLGVLAGILESDNQTIILHKRVAKTSRNKTGWEKVNTFTPTEISDKTTFARIYYKTQKFLHKDILVKQEIVEAYFDTFMVKCTGQILYDYLFYNIELPECVKTYNKRNLLTVPDYLLSGELLMDKMRLEIQQNTAPF